MAAGIQTNNGKAFEYACVMSLYNRLCKDQEVSIEDTPQFRTAKNFFNSMSEKMKLDLTAAANAATRVIIRLEPQLEYPSTNIPLYLSLQTDAQGIKGDVRDVLCIRRQNQWIIGLSCKHNHHAVKHSRLSDTIDFGAEWFNIPCSKQYFSEVVPLFSKLRKIRDDSKEDGTPALWSDIPNKAEEYYIPILQAFIKELKRIDSENAGVIPAARKFSRLSAEAASAAAYTLHLGARQPSSALIRFSAVLPVVNSSSTRTTCAARLKASSSRTQR